MQVLGSEPGAGHIYNDNACTLVEPMLTRCTQYRYSGSVEIVVDVNEFHRNNEEQYCLSNGWEWYSGRGERKFSVPAVRGDDDLKVRPTECNRSRQRLDIWRESKKDAVWMIHVAHMHESWHTHMRVMLHVWTSDTTDTHESWVPEEMSGQRTQHHSSHASFVAAIFTQESGWISCLYGCRSLLTSAEMITDDTRHQRRKTRGKLIVKAEVGNTEFYSGFFSWVVYLCVVLFGHVYPWLRDNTSWGMMFRSRLLQ